ncbi:twin-arginine translocation signal domain-containing protein [Shewanella sp. NIFS-20-20]|uniref:twin-arginine translocation signal domain-containing protein n=1 Tax=Shewanella sp. NIFS-20-20 TaxID=2853806 RepID=UPI001C46672E|nr:twin-arginine translocation signal domain-containing protein [Shewanella sp. NIFS-20-20]MBV7316067.1 twin-arginine translocation signal domain-containing protein [Shewanella sp. NIFS-20-20]
MKKQQPDLNRRSLLKALTVGSAAGAVIATTGVSVAQASEGSKVAKSEDGYHETAHIRAYYNSLRS